VKKVRVTAEKFKPMKIGVFMLAFAAIGSILLIISHAAPNGCDTTGVLGTVTNSISVPETGTYKVWVRMQVPETTNTSNSNGVRLELAGASTQCFTVTTTSSSAVNAWQWVNTDATAASTPLITASMTTGTYTSKILGLKAGVKVDKVILLKSDSTCIPSNDFTSGDPGENCTTPIPTVTLTANPTSVTSGKASALTWATTNATSCTAKDGWSGSKGMSGTNISTGNLTTTTKFTLSCTGPGGTAADASATVTVTAAPAPTVTFAASPGTVNTGGSSTLTWNVTNADTCTASGSWSGSKVVTAGDHTASTGALTATSTYALSCVGAGGTTNKNVTVTVNSTPPTDTTAPTVTMGVTGTSMSDGSIRVGDKSKITWAPVVTDGSGIKTVVYSVNGATVTLMSGAYEFGSQPGGNGDYTLKVVATDNSASANVTTTQTVIKLRYPDFNRDGHVNISDIGALTKNWAKASTNYDLTADGIVGISDIGILTKVWNP
jgi:hypothetical protein